jgi:hypothetical protein
VARRHSFAVVLFLGPNLLKGQSTFLKGNRRGSHEK